MRYTLTFLFIFIFSSPLYPQQVTNWKIFTDMKSVTDMNFSGETIWAATDGGAFKHSLTDNTYQKFTNAEGLRGISLTSLMIENSGAARRRIMGSYERRSTRSIDAAKDESSHADARSRCILGRS